MSTAPAPMIAPSTPTVGRQLRIGATEHDALVKAVGRGGQNAYIMKALRSQLKRDGHLTIVDTKPRRRAGAGKKRARRARAAR